LYIHEIRSCTDKVARIQLLQPYLKTNTLLFSNKHINLLEEMKFFPKGKFDDGLDALQMAMDTAREAVSVSGVYPVVIKRNPRTSDVLRSVPDLRCTSFPKVHKEKKDRFIPDPKDY